MKYYKIVRFFLSGRKPRCIKRDLTFEQAQAHCANLETSSSTATKARAKTYTDRYGPWFDGCAEDEW